MFFLLSVDGFIFYVFVYLAGFKRLNNVCQPVCLSIHTPVCPSTYQSTLMYVYLSTCLFICPNRPTHLPIACFPICLIVHLSVYLSLFIHPPVYLFVSPSFCPSTHPYIRLSISPRYCMYIYQPVCSSVQTGQLNCRLTVFPSV